MSTDIEKKIKRLERNRITAANIVKKHGKKYLCHFKRTNDELAKLKGDNDLMAEIEKLAA
jgi:hypothetical protein